MPRFSSAHAALDLLKPGQTVYIAGCFGEPSGFMEALRREPERAAGVTFTGVFIPGVNRQDLCGFGSDISVETFFVTPELHSSFESGRVRFLPLHYSQIVKRFAEPGRIDLAIMRVSPPNGDGNVSFGVAADFSPGIAALDIPLVAEVDEGMPFVVDGPVVPFSRFALAYEANTTPIYETGGLSPALTEIGRRIANLIRPGDTIQLGLGKVQKAVLQALHGHQVLNYHGGMIIDDIMPLLENGTVRSITTGVALGSPALTRFAAETERIAFRPVSFTHDIRTLAAIPGFVSINSALNVDLFGACSADVMDGRQFSGIGGLVDFHRGATASVGGRAIIALASTSSHGSVSRIVPVLPAGQAASLARADAAIVVTEHGVVDCRALDIDARADALICLADPMHRESLADQWLRLRRAL